MSGHSFATRALPCQPPPYKPAQIPGCNADLSHCKRYYQRYKLCAEHLNHPSLLLNGVPSRFCQK
jgi:hypothetical protein